MFKERIKEARQMNGISQRELARKVFLSQQTIGKYETGAATPSPEMVKQIAKTLNVSVSWLLEAEEASYSPEEIELINAYRRLDERGKRAVKALIASI